VCKERQSIDEPGTNGAHKPNQPDLTLPYAKADMGSLYIVDHEPHPEKTKVKAHNPPLVNKEPKENSNTTYKDRQGHP